MRFDRVRCLVKRLARRATTATGIIIQDPTHFYHIGINHEWVRPLPVRYPFSRLAQHISILYSRANEIFDFTDISSHEGRTIGNRSKHKGPTWVAYSKLMRYKSLCTVFAPPHSMMSRLETENGFKNQFIGPFSSRAIIYMLQPCPPVILSDAWLSPLLLSTGWLLHVPFALCHHTPFHLDWLYRVCRYSSSHAGE